MKDNYWILDRQDIDSSLRDVANEFLTQIKLAKYRPKTIYKYRKVLEGFLVNIPKALETNVTNDIRDWLNSWGVCCKIKIQKVASEKSRMLQLEIP